MNEPTIAQRVIARLTDLASQGTAFANVETLAAELGIRSTLLTAGIADELESGALVRFRDPAGYLHLRITPIAQPGQSSQAVEASQKPADTSKAAETADSGKNPTSPNRWPFPIKFEPRDDRSPAVKSGERSCSVCAHQPRPMSDMPCAVCDERTLSHFVARPGVDMARRAMLTAEGIANSYPAPKPAPAPAPVQASAPAPAPAEAPVDVGQDFPPIVFRPKTDGRSVTTDSTKWGAMLERLAAQSMPGDGTLPTIELSADLRHAVKKAVFTWNRRAASAGRPERLRLCVVRNTGRMLVQRAA